MGDLARQTQKGDRGIYLTPVTPTCSMVAWKSILERFWNSNAGLPRKRRAVNTFLDSGGPMVFRVLGVPMGKDGLPNAG